MINILMSGCTGRMGQVISRLCKESPNMKITAGISLEPEKHENNYPVYKAIEAVREKADVVIDFSHPSALPGLLEYCIRSQSALVVATTGLSDADYQMLQDASKVIPIFASANMSLGINVLVNLAKMAASALGSSFDIEIVEKHHNEKKDAPSGTALLIANELNEHLDNSMKYVYDRTPSAEKRQPHEIGIFSIRGGTIPGEHNVIFAGPDEVIEINHMALSRDIFGRGALKAAEYIVKKPNGYYDMKDMLKELIR